MNALVSVLGYGINGDLAVFGVLPYLKKELQTTMGGTRVTRSSKGFGDSSVFARYTFFKQDARGYTFRIAAFGGVKVPTGDDDESDALGRLPIPLQSGTGSWDGFGGVIATYQTLAFQVDAQASYTAKRETIRSVPRPADLCHRFQESNQIRSGNAKYAAEKPMPQSITELQ